MDFWVQRVATDGRSRVLINPTALIGACEIDKIAKFLLPLQCKKAPNQKIEGFCVWEMVKFEVTLDRVGNL